jgi:hypothetical protein
VRRANRFHFDSFIGIQCCFVRGEPTIITPPAEVGPFRVPSDPAQDER